MELVRVALVAAAVVGAVMAAVPPQYNLTLSTSVASSATVVNVVIQASQDPTGINAYWGDMTNIECQIASVNAAAKTLSQTFAVSQFMECAGETQSQFSDYLFVLDAGTADVVAASWLVYVGISAGNVTFNVTQVDSNVIQVNTTLLLDASSFLSDFTTVFSPATYNPGDYAYFKIRSEIPCSYTIAPTDIVLEDPNGTAIIQSMFHRMDSFSSITNDGGLCGYNIVVEMEFPYYLVVNPLASRSVVIRFKSAITAGKKRSIASRIVRIPSPSSAALAINLQAKATGAAASHFVSGAAALLVVLAVIFA